MNAVSQLKTAAEAEIAKLFVASGTTDAQRQKAFAHVDSAGLPHRRIEVWHYTDLRSMMRSTAPLAPAPSAELSAKRPWSLVKHDDVIAFVDGRCVKLPKLPHGVTVQNFADDPAALWTKLNKGFDLSADVVTSLNTTFLAGGVVIEVAKGVAVKEPISLAFETTDAHATHARVVVIMGDGASLDLIETHRGKAGAAAQINTVMECVLGDSAVLNHVRVNAIDVTAQTLSTIAASVAKEASFNTLSLTTGAALSRHQVFARVHGDNARVGVRGASLLKGEQHCDNTLVVEHDALNGESRELFRTVVDDEAKGIFQGKIIVKPHAQKTDGQMASNALLLGENSAMHGKPELEIFADDVVCAHGMTVGALDSDLLFYLMARGVPRKEAEGLMIQAFVGEVLEAVEYEELRDALVELVAQWIAERQ